MGDEMGGGGFLGKIAGGYYWMGDETDGGRFSRVMAFLLGVLIVGGSGGCYLVQGMICGLRKWPSGFIVIPKKQSIVNT
jgi:hypothetical protein